MPGHHIVGGHETELDALGGVGVTHHHGVTDGLDHLASALARDP
jgi:hypothetical protein